MQENTKKRLANAATGVACSAGAYVGYLGAFELTPETRDRAGYIEQRFESADNSLMEAITSIVPLRTEISKLPKEVRQLKQACVISSHKTVMDNIADKIEESNEKYTPLDIHQHVPMRTLLMNARDNLWYVRQHETKLLRDAGIVSLVLGSALLGMFGYYALKNLYHAIKS